MVMILAVQVLVTCLFTGIFGDVTERHSKNAGHFVSLKPRHMASCPGFYRIKLTIAKTVIPL